MPWAVGVAAAVLSAGCSVAAAPATPGQEGSVEDRPGFSTAGWKTDFGAHSVPFREITSGGPPKDGIPPIDRPSFVEASGKLEWLNENEPVIALVIGRDARAYHLQVLIWHEIANDTIGGVPVAVTFCPLCNTAIAFDRRLNGVTYDFGTRGDLRHSYLVMYDRQTESWWQQITGEAIVGRLTGKQLKMLPAAIVSFKDFRTAYPAGKILSRETGFDRNYGSNPYAGYDDVRSAPFLFRGSSDGRLRPMERVVTVSLDTNDVAFPFTELEERRVLNYCDLVIFWAPGPTSALDKEGIASSRDVGATGVFRAASEGRPLRFEPQAEGLFRDRETSTLWNVRGAAVSGPLVGQQLEPVVHGNHFWFAWAVFKPKTEVYRG